MLGLDSTAETAGTRPLMPAGPIDRALIPASRPGSMAARADEASRTRARTRRTGLRIEISRRNETSGQKLPRPRDRAGVGYGGEGQRLRLPRSHEARVRWKA